MSEEEVMIELIATEIKKGIIAARKAIKPHGATIPKSEIIVILKDGKGTHKNIKSIVI